MDLSTSTAVKKTPSPAVKHPVLRIAGADGIATAESLYAAESCRPSQSDSLRVSRVSMPEARQAPAPCCGDRHHPNLTTCGITPALAKCQRRSFSNI